MFKHFYELQNSHKGFASHSKHKELIVATQCGRSMVEMLGVLAIIGVLSVGGIAGYSKAMNKYKINKTTDQISMLVANIRTSFYSQGGYNGLDNLQAVKLGIVPNDMYKTTTCNTSSCELSNAFGGKVAIYAARDIDMGNPENMSSNENQSFGIVYSGLPAEACVNIATGDWGSGQSSGLLAIAAGNRLGSTSAQLNLDNIQDSIDGFAGIDGINSNTDPSKSEDGLAIATPGGKNVPTPMSVSVAVRACSCVTSDCEISWKYR